MLMRDMWASRSAKKLRRKILPVALIGKLRSGEAAKRRSPIKKMEDGPEKDLILADEKAKASVHGFVEHPFHILKNFFCHRKTRYRGLAKNYHQLQVLFGLGNLVVTARKLF